MSDDTEYRHVLHKISGVSNLTRERKNHKYVEEFLNAMEYYIRLRNLFI